jgi:hypothetical protein
MTGEPMDFLITIVVIIMASLFMLFIAAVFCFAMLSFLIGMGMFVLWIITLIDCIRRDNKDFSYGGKDAKVLWILLLVFFRQVVPIIYYLLIMYKKRVKPK